MDNSDTSPSVPRLDEETERYIGWVAMSGTVEALAALRSRIRTLIEEARKDATRGWMLVGPAGAIFPKREDSDV